MKILQINTVCGTGSTGKICQDLYWGLKKQGHDCKIAWGRKKNGTVPDCDTIQIGTFIDYYLHALSTRIFDNTGFCSINATKKLIEKIVEYNPDVIHIHNLHGYYVNIEILFQYLRCFKGKIIWTLHDCWAFTGHCTHFSYVNCDRWKSGCYKCQLRCEYPTSYCFDESKYNWNKKKEIFTSCEKITIVAPSQWLKSLIEKSYLNKYEIITVHNGIDVSAFVHKNSNFKIKNCIEDKKILLGVANVWNKKKGLNDFVALSKMIDDTYRIVLVGVSKKQKNQIPNNILCIERTQSVDELSDIYSSAEFFLNLTYEDTYPTVNIEAQACGCPVITYDTGGSPECVDRTSGYIVKQGDLKSILNILKYARRKVNFDRYKNSINYLTNEYLNIIKQANI